jgi:hypothetical protein
LVLLCPMTRQLTFTLGDNMPDAKVKIPLLGEVSKKAAIGGGIAIAGVAAILYYRYRKNAAAQAAQQQQTSASTGGMVTDPAGNTCAEVDPTTGYCPGTAEDEAAQESLGSELGESDEGEFGYGGGTGEYYTDPDGNICVTPDADGYCPVGTTTGTTGTSAPTTNAEWAEEVETAHPSWETAIDKVLGGVAVTTAQKNDFNEAVGLYGPPPQPYPAVHTKDTGGQPKANAGGKTVTANGSDDLYQIAKANGISETKLVALNPSLAKYVGSHKDIPKGTKVKV